MQKTKELGTYPVKGEVLTPTEFLKLPTSMVKSVRIIPPVLGSSGYGKIMVEYNHILYKTTRK